MHSARSLRLPSERTLNRLIVGAILVVVIGIPLIAVFYFFDRHVDPGPSLVKRRFSAAEEAVRKEPNRVSARLALATAYLAASRYADAVTQYGEVLRVEPDNRAALLGRGNASVSLGDFTTAQKDYQRMADIAKTGEMAATDPQLETAYYNLGSDR